MHNGNTEIVEILAFGSLQVVQGEPWPETCYSEMAVFVDHLTQVKPAMGQTTLMSCMECMRNLYDVLKQKLTVDLTGLLQCLVHILRVGAILNDLEVLLVVIFNQIVSFDDMV